MKRRLTKLVVFLLLGAVVNVAVAWACVWWSSVTPAGSLTQQRALELLQERQFFPQPGEPYWGAAEEGFGLTRLNLIFDPIVHGRTSDANLREGAWMLATFAGLPVRSLQAERRGVGLDATEVLSSLRVIGGIDLDHRTRERDLTSAYVLPLRPIWPGFAINTIFYAAILWLLTFGPFTMRRIVRRRCGRCVKCGYDLRGAEHEACPECGVEL